MTEPEGKYLAIKNWEKYQPSYTSKKRARWIKSWVDKYDDPDYYRLSAFQRHILDGIRDLRGKLGKNPPNDDHYISNALALHRGERTNVRRTLDHLLTIGFLLLCNQQMDVTNLNLDKSRVDKNRIETTKACRKPKPLAPIFVKPSLEEVKQYMLKIGMPDKSEGFIDHYASNGWKVGKNPMKDWQAAVRTWKRNNYGNGGNGNGQNGTSERALEILFGEDYEHGEDAEPVRVDPRGVGGVSAPRHEVGLQARGGGKGF